jgi:transposase
MRGEALPEREELVAPVIGIDVGKRWLDVFVYPVGHRMRLANDAAGIAALAARCLSVGAGLVVM